MELSNTSLCANKLDPSCSGQAHSNRPGTGPGYTNTEPGCNVKVLRVAFIICPLRSADAQSGKLFNGFRAADTNGPLDLKSLLANLRLNLRTHIKNRTRYDQGPRIDGKPKKGSLLVNEAQLAGYLKVRVSGPF